MLISPRVLAQSYGWPGDQYADPYHLFYVAGSGPGIAFYDSFNMLTSDATHLWWDPGSYQVNVRNPTAGNSFGCYTLWNDSGTSIGAQFCFTANSYSVANDYPNALTIGNFLGKEITIKTGGVPARTSVYFQGQSEAAGAAQPSIAFSQRLPTNGADGFVYLPTTAGVPTGVPTTLPNQFANDVPIVYDVTDSKLYCYNGSWAPCDPSGGSGTVIGPLSHDVTTPSSSSGVASVVGLTSTGAVDHPIGTLTNSQCMALDVSGNIVTVACSAGGTVTVVTGSDPIFITSTPTTTPNVTIQGAITSGSTSTTKQNIGLIATSMLACATSGGVCTVDGVTVGGGLTFNTGTATETLASFTCGANTFASSSSTSGLACTQPSFANLSGSATCAQLPALTGDVTTSAGTCGTTLVNIPNDTTM